MEVNIDIRYFLVVNILVRVVALMQPEVVVLVVIVFVELDYYIVGQEHQIVGLVHCIVVR